MGVALIISRVPSGPTLTLRVPRSRPGTQRTGPGSARGALPDAALDGRGQGGRRQEGETEGGERGTWTCNSFRQERATNLKPSS